tara:strand:- start:335 stop:505 length:171 start_codon:yes stop_codon:yes gene_type:complete
MYKAGDKIEVQVIVKGRILSSRVGVIYNTSEGLAMDSCGFDLLINSISSTNKIIKL